MAVRPIDANAMLNELKPVGFEAEHSAVLLSDVSKMMREWVERQPTLTPPNEWVSVEQAMPPEHETVLCIVSGKPKPNIMLEDAYQLGSWNKADGWIIDEWLDWEGANVTWWMKLPEPPDRRPPEGVVYYPI